MDLFFSYYQLILIPLWPVLWDYKVPIFEVPIMGTFTNSDEHSSQRASPAERASLNDAITRHITPPMPTCDAGSIIARLKARMLLRELCCLVILIYMY